MKNKVGITIVGLGPGDPGLLTREAWEILSTVEEIYLRTRQHPTVDGFPEGLKVNSFDYLYEQNESFVEVYQQIIKEVLKLGEREEGVVYAVPGHPLIAEYTGPEIIRIAKEREIPARLVEGLSFLEPTLALIGVDPLPNLSIVDGVEVATAHHPSFPPSHPALIAQVYSKAVAAEVKITLTAIYPDEHPVILVHGAGSENPNIEHVPLYAIDQSDEVGLLTSLFVPPLGENTSFEDFQELIAHLRAPEGCPWDREQTHQSLRINLLEEAYEALEALDLDDPEMMKEEFGDLLLQIVLHAQIATEYGEFTMSDIINTIHTKLVRRHPHVFGDENIDDSDNVIRNWERLKAKERNDNGDEDTGLLDGISMAMPALSVADAYQRRAARVGFDWPNIDGALEKVDEEMKEFQDASNAKEKREEIGDLLFALANLARWLEIDPEVALRETNLKFRKRFKYIEEKAKTLGKSLEEMSLEEMDAIWNESKSNK